MSHPWGSAEWIEDVALDLLVILFTLPVVLGCLLYLFAAGGEYALVVRTLGEHPWRDACLGLGSGTAALALGGLLAPRFASTRRMVDGFSRVVGHPSWSTCVIVALSSAVGEELLFRAVLQEVLGWPAATALFAVIHLPVDRDLRLWPLLALPIGLGLAALYAYSGAVLAPIAAHGLLTFVALRWISRRASDPDVRRAPDSAS